jgi:two-component system chemotaxis sensor kinase CheA
MESYKILLVDDDEGNLEGISGLLTKAGYETITANQASTALEILKNHHKKILFIISDYQMPEVNGIQLRQKILDTPQKDIPFAILSGYVDRQMALEGVDAKICAFLQKITDIGDIKSVILRESKGRLEELKFSEEIKKTYIQESKDLIGEVEPLLLQLEIDPTDSALVNQIYRLIHTIKGGSSVLDQEDFSKYLHQYEDIYTHIKNGNLITTSQVVSSLLKGFDHISSFIQSFDHKEEPLFSAFQTQETQEEKTANSTILKKSPSQKKKDAISVPMGMMDELMAQSGEITVIRNMVNKLVGAISKEMPGNKNVRQLEELLDEMHKINSSIQRRITEIRKVSMSSVYRAIPRTVRDVCQTTGKQVKVTMQGEDLRVDKVISQALNNSLVHMVRNSVDHGIEIPEIRKKIQKKEEGTLSIKSCEEGDTIVVHISDDGAGIDPNMIRQKVIEKKLITKDEADKLSDKKILSYIFEPGFSTAQEVTDISGRGVGMDVVKTSIEELGGRIDIDSEKDKGTRFTLTIPIPKSVQIIDALIVSMGPETLAIPQDNIFRLMIVTRNKEPSYIRNAEGSELLLMDGKLIPILVGKTLLGLQGDSSRPREERHFIIVQTEHKNMFCLEVDAIKDNESVVVKSLEPVISELKVYKGSTFLNDGSVGMILNVDGLFDFSSLVRETENDPLLKEQSVSQGNDYVAFELNADGRYAIALNQVFRLENLPRASVQFSGDQRVLFYREELIPLYRLDELLTVKRKDGTEGKNDLLMPIIIISHNDRLIAFEIKKLIDIFKDCPDIESKGLHKNNGIMGNILIQEKIHSVISPGDLFSQ